MSKQILDGLPKDQQDIIVALGAELEKFGTQEAMADDQKVAEVYAKKGAKVADPDEAPVDKSGAISPAAPRERLSAKGPASANCSSSPRTCTFPDRARA